MDPVYTLDYYFDATDGDDASNNGTSMKMPWKTLSKINSLNLFSGNHLLFRR